MKRFIAGVLALLLPMLSHGAALDIFMNQRDATNTNTLTKTVPHPAGTADGVMGYLGAAQAPGFLSVGPGLTLSGGILDATVTWASITGKPVLFNGAYASLTGIPATFAPTAHTQAFSTITATPTTLAGYGITDALPRPTGTTAQYLRGDGSLATLPSTAPALTINDTPGRTLGAAYQISATRAAHVCYEGTFSTTSTIGGPSSATVFLETSDNGTDWSTRAQQTYSNTITLAIVLNQVQSNNWSFCRIIPAGKFVRLRSGNISGTASVSLNATQQETLY